MIEVLVRPMQAMLERVESQYNTLHFMPFYTACPWKLAVGGQGSIPADLAEKTHEGMGRTCKLHLERLQPLGRWNAGTFLLSTTPSQNTGKLNKSHKQRVTRSTSGFNTNTKT